MKMQNITIATILKVVHLSTSQFSCIVNDEGHKFISVISSILTTFVVKRKNNVNSLKILMKVVQHMLFRYPLRNFGVIVLVSELQAAQNRQFSTKKRAKIRLRSSS